ncbi:MAG: flagellar basal body-associated FliL family protein [Rhizobiales bacterium]|nr:flagellar basal body-associated FliL family protein [Hyphomicrobiales bacterium]MBN9008690.1 flagellar basal body-associated FliL family protein [Hyphomicrobiales bacterium]
MEDEEDAGGAAKPKALPAPLPDKKKGGIVGMIVGIVVVTALAAGLGMFLGQMTAKTVEQAVADREKAKPKDEPIRSTRYTGDMTLQPIEAIVTNLGQPSDTWIRMETAMVFQNGALKNPEVTAAEIRQDLITYARTITLAQLEGPSALQHLREDLNERVAARTNGAVSELVIETLVVQ